MNRKAFLSSVGLLSLSGIAFGTRHLSKLAEGSETTPLMPVLFLGHGSPMNAIEENEFVAGFRAIGKDLPKPKAILCISAHWETNGTFVTAMEYPRTIHDFGAFPKALYDVQYPAPGSPELAKNTQNIVSSTEVKADYSWGLDHGAWTVIKHLYPKADVPVVQMSIDRRKPAAYHFELAKELRSLRSKGVLIIGSGNMIHNLSLVDWKNLHLDNHAYDWALEAREKMNGFILRGEYDKLINYKTQGKAFELAIPTPEHFLPLLYTLGLHEPTENISLFNDKAMGGSLSMTSIKIS